MRKVFVLIKNVVLLLAIVILFDRGLGSVLEYYFNKEKTGDNAKTRHALSGAKEDIVIFGSSRAAHHYVPEELEEATGMSCFNAGRDGMKMTYYKLLLDAMLEYHQPKVVILDLNYNYLVTEARKDDALIAGLLPYMQNRIVSEFIFENAPLEAWKARVSKLYQFNSKPATILHHNMGFGQADLDGYEPLKGSKIGDGYQVHINTSQYTEDPDLVRKFEEFVKTVKDRGIELYIVYSPSLMQIKYDYLSTPKRISAKYRVPLLNFSQYFTLKDKYLFYDKTHMNSLGAERFTQEILSRLVNTKRVKITQTQTSIPANPVSIRFPSPKRARAVMGSN